MASTHPVRPGETPQGERNGGENCGVPQLPRGKRPLEHGGRWWWRRPAAAAAAAVAGRVGWGIEARLCGGGGRGGQGGLWFTLLSIPPSRSLLSLLQTSVSLGREGGGGVSSW